MQIIKEIRSNLKYLMVVNLLLVLYACGSSGEGEGNKSNPDLPPTVTSKNPLDSSILRNNQQIIVSFSKSMDTATLSLGVDMGAESDGGAWSTDRYVDDTLTVSPNTVWSNGDNRELSINVSDLMGNAIEPENIIYSVDSIVPTANINPISGSVFEDNTQFVVSFSESMDITSAILGGDLGNEDNGGIWSTTTYENDTLTISPASVWTVGNGKTLVVDAKDLAGNPVETLLSNYTDDIVTPTVLNMTPPDTVTLGGSQQVTITFSETMDKSTLGLGGALGAEANDGVWSMTTVIDDTLTISPATTWSGGNSLAIIIDATDLAGNPIATESRLYSVDSTLPTAIVNPNTGEEFNENASLVITFSESMEPSTFTLGGDLSTEAASVWSTVTNADDTLTISPVSAWTLGNNKTLIIDVDDVAGNALARLNLSYSIANAIYVSTAANGGNDNNVGSAGAPKLTISAAITAATSQYSSAEIRVSQGRFTVNPSSGAGITMVEGMSLFGGYAVGWGSRDPATFTTTISNASTFNSGQTIFVSNSITAATIIDGFTISASSGAIANAIDINRGAVTIRNNIILGGTGASRSSGYALRLQNALPSTIISDNTINGGFSSPSIGIELSNSSPLISGNSINGGGLIDVTTSSYGIRGTNSSPIIENNTIVGGSLAGIGSSYGVRLSSLSASSTTPIIRNNTIKGGTTSTAFGIINLGIGASSTINNNNISSQGWVTSIGISLGENTEAKVFNNTMDVGDSASLSNIRAGIEIYKASPIIRNNIIDGGANARDNYGISITYPLNGAHISSPTIENNIIYTSNLSITTPSTINRYCIGEVTRVGFQIAGATDDPASVQNNNLFDCPTALYQDNDNAAGANNLTTIIAVESDLNAEAIQTGGNVSLIPKFINQTAGNLHFITDGTSPCSVTSGGIDGVGEAWLFIDDADGLTRTGDVTSKGWSMGAYEYDGGCTP